jgi:hypothetical protein
MRSATCGATPWCPAAGSVPGCDARRHRAVGRTHGAAARMHRAAARPLCRSRGRRRPPRPERHGAQSVLCAASSRSVRHGYASRPLAREVALTRARDDASGDAGGPRVWTLATSSGTIKQDLLLCGNRVIMTTRSKRLVVAYAVAWRARRWRSVPDRG